MASIDPAFRDFLEEMKPGDKIYEGSGERNWGEISINGLTFSTWNTVRPATSVGYLKHGKRRKVTGRYGYKNDIPWEYIRTDKKVIRRKSKKEREFFPTVTAHRQYLANAPWLSMNKALAKLDTEKVPRFWYLDEFTSDSQSFVERIHNLLKALREGKEPSFDKNFNKGSVIWVFLAMHNGQEILESLVGLKWTGEKYELMTDYAEAMKAIQKHFSPWSFKKRPLTAYEKNGY